MPPRDRREFIPFLVELDGQQYEVHPGGRVYFRTEESTLRRVKDKELVRRVREAVKGVEWAPGVRA